MATFCTTMRVWDNVYSQLVTVEGPRFEAPNIKLAQEQIDKEGYRWLTITGELVSEIPCKKESTRPDWKRKIDYQKIQQN